MTIVDLVGCAGTLIVSAAYLATQMRVLNSDDLVFPLANMLGSSLILVSLYFHFNLASVMIEGFWICISGVGIWRGRREEGKVRRGVLPGALKPDGRSATDV